MTPTGVRGGGSIEVIAWLLVVVFVIIPVIGFVLFALVMVLIPAFALLFAVAAIIKETFFKPLDRNQNTN